MTVGEARDFLCAGSGSTSGHIVVDCSSQAIAAVGVARAVRPHCNVVSARGYVRHCSQGLGLGTYIARWVQATAGEIATRAPTHPHVAVRQRVSSRDIPARDLLLRFGYKHTRTIHRMEMHLSRDVRVAPPPVTTLHAFDVTSDYEDYVRLAREVNSENPVYVSCSLDEDLVRYKSDVPSAPHFDPALFVVARISGHRVAYCIGRMGDEGSEDTGTVQGLGVSIRHRRKGLGSSVLAYVLSEFYSRGVERVVLYVDGTNSAAALGLYLSMGMKIADTDFVYDLGVE